MTDLPAAELADQEAGLLIQRVVVGPLETNCWIVGDVASRQAVLIDPGDEPERVLEAVEGLTPTAIVLTHAHWDHVLGLPDVAEALGIPVLAHPDDAPVWPHELDQLARRRSVVSGTASPIAMCNTATGSRSEPAHSPYSTHPGTRRAASAC